MSAADCLAPGQQGRHLLALSRIGICWHPSGLPRPCQDTLRFTAQLLAVYQLWQLHRDTALQLQFAVWVIIQQSQCQSRQTRAVISMHYTEPCNL